MLIRNLKYKGTVNKRLKLTVLFVLLLLNISYSAVYAQKVRSETPPLKERLFYGGSLGLMFGTLTDIDISPIIGLWVFPRLNVAAGPKYEYYKYYDERASFYGGRVYSQFFFIRDLDNIIPLGVHLGFFVHAEDEFFKLEYTDGVDTFNPFVNTPLVGGGISEPLGGRASMNLMFLWALDDFYGLYSEPEIRISVTF
jgi:hypothetical protein